MHGSGRPSLNKKKGEGRGGKREETKIAPVVLSSARKDISEGGGGGGGYGNGKGTVR